MSLEVWLYSQLCIKNKNKKLYNQLAQGSKSGPFMREIDLDLWFVWDEDYLI